MKDEVGVRWLPRLPTGSSLREGAKAIAFRYTRLAAPTYPYPNVEPIELAALINEIERLKAAQGNILEIGVARGMTTRFLCEHIVRQKLENNLTLFAIDTFSSFTSEHLDYEVKERGKLLDELRAFEYNNYRAWKRNFSQYPFVNAIIGDCSNVDYSKLSPIKVSFIDVDLYLPTKKALYKVYDATIEGGVILVDDVRDKSTYDGAYQAYMEVCSDLKINPIVIGNKCGVIYKFSNHTLSLR